MPASTHTAPGTARRAEIVRAAAELFDEHGFHRTSTAAIADRVGTAKATVYHYFRAKHEILYAIHDAWIDDLLTMYEERLRTGAEPVALLHSVFHDLLVLIDRRPGHVRVFFEYFRELPPESQAAARVKRDRYEALVEAAVTDGIRSGILRSLDARTTTLALFGMCNWAYRWYSPTGRYGPETVADQLFSVFLDGVRGPSTGGPR